MMKHMTVTVLLAVAGLAQASLLVNGDFSSNSIDGGDNALVYSQVDTGWVAKNGWNASTGAAVNQNGYQTGEYGGLSQVVSVSGLSVNQLELSFDFTPPSVVTTNVSLQLRYQIIGWTMKDASITNSSAGFFWGQNYSSLNIDNASGEATWDDMLTADKQSNNGRWNASEQIVTGAGAGTESGFTVYSVDGLDLSSYDFIGVRFSSVSRDDATDMGSIVDNVSLTAIPEPATLGLVAAVGGAVLFIRRRFMM